MSKSVHTGLGARLVSSSSTALNFQNLPILDISLLSNKNSTLEERLKLAGEIQEACINSGFFYVKNHGVPSTVLSKVFKQAKIFFDQSMEQKMLVDMHKSTSFKGYLPSRGEQVDPASKGDIHESFDVGSTFVSADGTVQTGNQFPPNKEDLPEFEDSIQDAWDSIMDLGNKLFPMFALALDLEEDYFAQYLSQPGSIMRVLHYPPQFGEVDIHEIGIGAHSDYEFFTLLVQDKVKALQVLNSDGEWIEAPPIDGTIVVNVGDMLQRWSNDVFKSTIHRAINRTGLERYSLPFFFGVDYSTLIEVLPSCISEATPCKYEPIIAGEWVESRLAETYVKS